MPAEWYCQIENGEQEIGPLTVEQLRTLARSGRLTRSDFVRKGQDGEWVAATRAKGLFEDGEAGRPMDSDSGELQPGGDRLPATLDPGMTGDPRLKSIRSVKACLSDEELKKRFGVTAVNAILWFGLMVPVLATAGGILLIYAAIWLINQLLSEYNVRKLQAIGTEATDEQFPEIARALASVCQQFGVEDMPKVIVLNVSEVNAFAIKFARKKVIVLLSQTLEGIVDKPEQLRFILGHELAHIVLDHGTRGAFELYKPAAYKAARELTCDNCGCAAAGNFESAKTVLKRLGVGNTLYSRLDEEFLIAEAEYIYSGLTGWLLKRHLTYPPLGKRIANLTTFIEAA